MQFQAILERCFRLLREIVHFHRFDRSPRILRTLSRGHLDLAEVDSEILPEDGGYLAGTDSAPEVKPRPLPVGPVVPRDIPRRVIPPEPLPGEQNVGAVQRELL